MNRCKGLGERFLPQTLFMILSQKIASGCNNLPTIMRHNIFKTVTSLQLLLYLSFYRITISGGVQSRRPPLHPPLPGHGYCGRTTEMRAPL